jgi:hypothetical protein
MAAFRVKQTRMWHGSDFGFWHDWDIARRPIGFR